MRVEKAREDFKFLGVDNLVTVKHRNICEEGFPSELPIIQDFEGLPKPTIADAVFFGSPYPMEGSCLSKDFIEIVRYGLFLFSMH